MCANFRFLVLSVNHKNLLFRSFKKKKSIAGSCCKRKVLPNHVPNLIVSFPKLKLLNHELPKVRLFSGNKLDSGEIQFRFSDFGPSPRDNDDDDDDEKDDDDRNRLSDYPCNSNLKGKLQQIPAERSYIHITQKKTYF